MSYETLRDRIKHLVDETDDGESAARAIIDDLGLTVEDRLTEYGIDDPGYESRVVGKWEEEK
ncbi:Uncharacterised protein [Brevibacterium casei]|uniref:Uncharacterized protein n=1 Tax=Brevibacterium casei TaxID=33889 RepID=A0A449D7G5_9MICO|nr:hypothetical protein [Brevibacterium casei]VEW13541.1 Uncharacterised protein [Brevibacterium casei]